MTTTITQPKCAKADNKTIIIDRSCDGSLGIEILGGTNRTNGDYYGYFDRERAAEIVAAISREMNLRTVEVPVVPKKSPNGPQAYKGNGKHFWETVVEGDEEEDVVAILRLRVPGGWLYSSDDDACPMTFVPTPAVVGYAI